MIFKWFALLRNENNQEYYSDFKDERKPLWQLYSKMTGMPYVPLLNIDDVMIINGFRSFKRGYTLIQSVLLKISNWQNFPPAIDTETTQQFMIQVCLEKMAQILFIFIAPCQKWVNFFLNSHRLTRIFTHARKSIALHLLTWLKWKIYCQKS